MKDLKYYKNNCEEDHIHTPISVLRYITELEKEVESKPLIIHSVVKSFTAEEVVNELKENETLDDAISFFNSQKLQLVCDDNELDCPYEFTSRCTIGRCCCKPKAN